MVEGGEGLEAVECADLKLDGPGMSDFISSTDEQDIPPMPELRHYLRH